MLVHADAGVVDHLDVAVVSLRYGLQKPVPHAGPAPAVEAPGPSRRDARDHLDQGRLTGTRPSQAARSRALRKVSPVPIAATSAVALRAPKPGMVARRRAAWSSRARATNSAVSAAMHGRTPFEAHVLGQETGAGAQSVGGSAPSARIVTRTSQAADGPCQPRCHAPRERRGAG